MSKKGQGKANSSSSDNQSYDVQKIVNQRVINGKKQYKVIWAGYSFQEATWEPQENLKCPEKINQFLRRYQDVMKRKNLLKTNQSERTKSLSISQVQKPKVQQPQKISVQKIQFNPLAQQKIIANQSASLNREKLQASLQKNSLISQKRPQDIQSLKQKIMSPQATSQSVKIPFEEAKLGSNSRVIKQPTIRNWQQFHQQKPLISTSPINLNGLKESFTLPTKSNQVQNSNLKFQGSKVIKIQIKPQKIQAKENNYQKLEENVQKISPKTTSSQNQVSKKLPQKTIQWTEFQNPRKSVVNNISVIQGSQQRKISQIQCSSESINEKSDLSKGDQQVWLKINEKLDIESIEGFKFQNQINPEKNKFSDDFKTSMFFMIKNKFSEKQKLVERERIIAEEPLKLIEFYQRLLEQVQ